MSSELSEIHLSQRPQAAKILVTELLTYDLGVQIFSETWQRMYAYTSARQPESQCQIWMLQHHPVFTLGQNGKPEHILCAGNIPIVQTDRGGQVTYHGPGQLVAYVLINLRRYHLSVRGLVCLLEKAVIACLATLGIAARGKIDAPGVYVGSKKICSIGLRIKRGCSYHGIALNVDMDLEPFSRINPCGFQGLKMIQIADLTAEKVNFLMIQQQLDACIRQGLIESYNDSNSR